MCGMCVLDLRAKAKRREVAQTGDYVFFGVGEDASATLVGVDRAYNSICSHDQNEVLSPWHMLACGDVDSPT